MTESQTVAAIFIMANAMGVKVLQWNKNTVSFGYDSTFTIEVPGTAVQPVGITLPTFKAIARRVGIAAEITCADGFARGELRKYSIGFVSAISDTEHARQVSWDSRLDVLTDTPEAIGWARSIRKAVGHDRSRPNLSGIGFQRTADSFVFGATDTHRMHVAGDIQGFLNDGGGPWIPVTEQSYAAINLPGVMSILQGPEGEIIVRGETWTHVTPKEHGVFPNLRRVVPALESKIAFDGAELREAARNLHRWGDANRLRFTVDGQVCRVAAKNYEYGMIGTEIGCHADPGWTSFCINSGYLLNALELVNSTTVILQAPDTEGNKPFSLVSETGEAMALVMPMAKGE